MQKANKLWVQALTDGCDLCLFRWLTQHLLQGQCQDLLIFCLECLRALPLRTSLAWRSLSLRAERSSETPDALEQWTTELGCRSLKQSVPERDDGHS